MHSIDGIYTARMCGIPLPVPDTASTLRRGHLQTKTKANIYYATILTYYANKNKGKLITLQTKPMQIYTMQQKQR